MRCICSIARDIQQPAMEIWSGQDATEKMAKQAMQRLARGNKAAPRGEYCAAMSVIDA
ncbi:MAG: fructose-bisphosphate aldolase [Thiogranum sp.]|nr:fructose-bisphosphate aldolase [Thiogranum sp.]